MQSLIWHTCKADKASTALLCRVRNTHRRLLRPHLSYLAYFSPINLPVRCYAQHGRQAKAKAEKRSEDNVQHHEQRIKDILLQDKSVINHYHQDFPWSKRRRRFDPNDSADADESGEVKALELEMKRLDDEIRHMEELDNGKTLMEPLLEDLSPEDRRWLRQDIQAREEGQAERAKLLKDFLPKLTIKCPVLSHRRPYLDSLNASIKSALVRSGDANVRRQLWQSYVRCKAFLPPFLHLVPSETWILLARTQSLAFAENDTKWAAHSIALFEDMRLAGQDLEIDHLMLFIEALRTEHRHERSIIEWLALGTLIDKDQRYVSGYQKLGCRIYISKGDLMSAYRIAKDHLQNPGGSDPRILLPVLRAWAQSGNDIEVKYAWALYHTLRLALRSQITAEDYDHVYIGFLQGGRSDLAMVVFRDMMLTGQNSQHDSLKVQQSILPELEERLLNGSDRPDISHVSLTHMLAIPYGLKDKFFYSKWIKRLIGIGELSSAVTVVEFMQRNQATPAAKHLNGVLGGLMRLGNVDAAAQAEAMAWGMVHQRSRFVRRRKGLDPIAFTEDKSPDGKVSSVTYFQNCCFPAATIETYSLLLQLYVMQSKYEMVDRVQRALRDGEVIANAEYNNQLMYLDLQRQQYSAAWQRYLSIKEGAQCLDLDTFDCLWRCESAHRVQKTAKLRPDTLFPPPRRLLAEMAKQFETCSGTQRQMYSNIPRPMYESILGCFLRDKDFAGVVVSIALLQKLLGAYVDSVTIASITKNLTHNVANLGSSRSQRRAGRFARLDRSRQKRDAEACSKDSMESATAVATERLRKLDCRELDELAPDQRRKESLGFITQYVQAMLQHVEPRSDLRQEILDVADDMGVRNLVEEDLLDIHLNS